MGPRLRAVLLSLFTGLGALLVHGCAESPAVRRAPPGEDAAKPAPPRQPPPQPTQPPPKPKEVEIGRVLARSDEYVVVSAGRSDTAESLAERFLGNAKRSWVIEDFNRIRRVAAGQEVVIPLRPQNPAGVHSHGFQSVPILCYHRFGEEKARMVVSPESFREQMEYLADNGYRVIPLGELPGFLDGREALPERSVVISFDDGYKSTYLVAYPILKAHWFPATIFVYTDFVNAKAALTWAEMREMVDSGLIDIQSHSKAHSNLALHAHSEDESAYRQRVAREISVPSAMIRENLGVTPRAFAYPYGDANELVLEQVRAADYAMAVTVRAGGNPFYAYPLMLRRTMVYGEDDLAAFARKLDVFHGADLRVSGSSQGPFGWTLAAAELPGHGPVSPERGKIRLPPLFAVLDPPPLVPGEAARSAGPRLSSALESPGHGERKRRALDLARDGEWARALAEWKILQALDPGNAEYGSQISAVRTLIRREAERHHQAGEAAFRRGDFERAQTDFLRELALDPLDTAALPRLREIDRERALTAEAAWLAKLYPGGGRPAAGKNAPQSRTAGAASGGQERDYLETGIALYRQGKYEASILEIEKYLSSFPNDAEAQAYVSQARSKLRRAEPVTETRQPASQERPGAPPGRLGPAERPALGGSPGKDLSAQAQELYEQGLRVHRTDLSKAIEYWEQSLALNPSHVQATQSGEAER